MVAFVYELTMMKKRFFFCIKWKNYVNRFFSFSCPFLPFWAMGFDYPGAFLIYILYIKTNKLMKM